MLIEHKGLSVRVVIKDTITQGDLETMADRWIGERNASDSHTMGALVRAAVASGWILEPSLTPEQVLGMDPRAVRCLAESLFELYTELTTVPPDPSWRPPKSAKRDGESRQQN